MTNENGKEESPDDFWGEPIHKYTREQAIQDGVLVDVSDTAKEAGFKFPVALTAAAWATAVECSENEKDNGQDEKGRLWDILVLLHFAIKSSKGDGSRIDFKVVVYRGGKHEDVELYALCGPGDNAEPVITIMLPGED